MTDQDDSGGGANPVTEMTPLTVDIDTTGLGWPASAVPRIAPIVRLPWYPSSIAQWAWLGHHPRLLAAWGGLAGPAEFLQWAFASLDHPGIEVVNLRSSWNSGGYYHWAFHAIWSRVRRKGIDYREGLKLGPEAGCWADREATLIRAVDELHDDLAISAETLGQLRLHFDERELIEICFITGHYELLAMTYESIGLPYDGWRPEPPSEGGPLPRRRRQPREPHSPTHSPTRPPGVDQRTGPRQFSRAWFPYSTTATTILGAHPALNRLLRFFASNSTRFATLDARDQELAVLRALWTCGPHEEWSHHATMASHVGLDEDDVERVTNGPDAPGWRPRDATLLRAVDELDSYYFVGDDTWLDLAAYLDPPQLIELGFLVGHCRTFAMLLNTLGPKEGLH